MTRMNLIVKDLHDNPGMWHLGEFNLTRKKSEDENTNPVYGYNFEHSVHGYLAVWIASGFWFYSVYSPAKELFSFLEKIQFHFAFAAWKRRTHKDQKSVVEDFIKHDETLDELNRAWKLKSK